MTDLVQVDIDTALVMYSMGETHIRCLQRDVFSDDWTNMQPLYLDEILNGLTIFVSDKRRAELLNPPKVDISKIKEEIALERRNLLSDDEDDYDGDPDWTEEPAQVETIPDDDEVPERDRIPYDKPEVITVEQVTAKTDTKTDKSTKELAEEMIAKIQAGDSNPLPWNVRDAISLHDKDGMSYGNLAKLYGIKSPQTVINRINQYKMK
jgi:DNA-directed RNA polymerase specialized sigma24 family protein